MATITRENIGRLNEKITIKVSREDYLDSFEKSLKQYSKKANLPGFRKGMVPTGMIRKMHGPAVFTDEVLRTVEKELNHYMDAEKLDIFAQPLPMRDQPADPLDMNNPSDYVFAFEIGLKPAFQLRDLASLQLPSHQVIVTEEMVTEEVKRLQTRHGKMTHPEETTTEDNLLNITFTECDAQGNPSEGGVHKENSLLIKYFKESFREKLLQKKVEDFFILQPITAFEEKERAWVLQDLGFPKDDTEAATRYFKMVITKVGLVIPAELNEEFFKSLFPAQSIQTEEEFRAAIREDIQGYWNRQSRNQLQHELYHVLIEQTQIEFPDVFLKKWLQQSREKAKTDAEVEQEFPDFLQQLKWTLITDKIVREKKIEVSPDDLKKYAQQQLMGYMGMTALQEEQPWMQEYLNRMMQDRKFVEDAYHRIQAEKVLDWAADHVGKQEKSLSVEDFTKELEKHQHHHH